MKQFSLFIIFFFFCNFIYGQDSIIYVHSWKKPKKIDKITNDIYLNIKLNESDSAYIGTSPKIYRGLLLSITTTELTMTIAEEELFTKRQNGSTVEIINHYYFPDSLKKISDGELRVIPIKQIQSLSYFHEKPISNIGGALAALSFITALVVAPLVSINYKTGRFNEKRYFPVLLGSASGIALGLTLNIGFRKNKHYEFLNYTPDSGDNNYYYISNK